MCTGHFSSYCVPQIWSMEGTKTGEIIAIDLFMNNFLKSVGLPMRSISSIWVPAMRDPHICPHSKSKYQCIVIVWPVQSLACTAYTRCTVYSHWLACRPHSVGRTVHAPQWGRPLVLAASSSSFFWSAFKVGWEVILLCLSGSERRV